MTNAEKATQHKMRLALSSASGLLRGMLRAYPVITADTLEILNEIESAIGACTPATPQHDAGAVARCSFCGRYSADCRAIGIKPFLCDCGKPGGWSGSFVRPTEDARWSFGLAKP